MTKMDDLHAIWMRKAAYREAYGALAEEFTLAEAMIGARAKAGLTQEEVAQRMNTTQTVVARLESGRSKPSTRTLERFAEATGARLKISFESRRKRA